MSYKDAELKNLFLATQHKKCCFKNSKEAIFLFLKLGVAYMCSELLGCFCWGRLVFLSRFSSSCPNLHNLTLVSQKKIRHISSSHAISLQEKDNCIITEAAGGDDLHKLPPVGCGSRAVLVYCGGGQHRMRSRTQWIVVVTTRAVTFEHGQVWTDI